MNSQSDIPQNELFLLCVNAIFAQNFEEVEKLLDKGLDVNYKPDTVNHEEDVDQPVDGDLAKWNLIQYAVDTSTNQIVNLLLDRGANIEVEDEYGNGPLFAAVRSNRNEIIDILLNRGININHINGSGHNIFRSTLPYSHHITVETFSQLLDRGADINHVDNHGNTPIFNIVSNYSTDHILPFLEKGADVNHKNNKGDTPLLNIFIYRKNVKVIAELLINYGADVDVQNQHGSTALMKASFRSDYDTIKILLEKNANPFLENIEGKTFLDYLKNEDKKKYYEKWIEENYGMNVKPVKKEEN